MTKISVVVPVYKVEQYLRKCLDSLVNQTLDDIEIIVINDGSPDNSDKIMKEYQKRYPKKIKCFYTENGGVSAARNYGIGQAKGEYLGFVDSDDWAELNMFEELYNKAISNDYDMAECELNYVYKDKTKSKSLSIKRDLYSKEEIKQNMRHMYPVVWNKIYKRKLFNQFKFKRGVWYEDVELLYKLYSKLNNIGFVNKGLYNYLQRDSSITSTFDKRLYNYIDNWNDIIDYYKSNDLYNEYRDELEYCYVRYLYATFLKGASNYSDNREYKKAVVSAKENVMKYFPQYRKNKYFYTSGIKGYYLLLFNDLFASALYFIKKIKRMVRL